TAEAALLRTESAPSLPSWAVMVFCWVRAAVTLMVAAPDPVVPDGNTESEPAAAGVSTLSVTVTAESPEAGRPATPWTRIRTVAPGPIGLPVRVSKIRV